MSWGRFLLLGDLGQQLDINEMQEHVERMRNERDLANWDLPKIKAVADELLDLELQHNLLVRLLIKKGAITAEEYASSIAAPRPKPAPAADPRRTKTWGHDRGTRRRSWEYRAA